MSNSQANAGKHSSRSMKQGSIPLDRARKVAEMVCDQLRHYCSRIEIAGSIRRRRPWVNDVDLVLIPSDLWQLHGVLMKLNGGKLNMSGPKILQIEVALVPIDIYVGNEETWATLLLIRTGSTAHNIMMCTRAKGRGWHLHASGEGLFNERGERIAWQTEQDIFKALGLKWEEPPERE